MPASARVANLGRMLGDMALLLLIRHAESSGNVSRRLTGRTPGVRLTEHGRAQAVTLAERLGPVPIKAIYSSPLERCLETAEPLRKAKGLPLEADQDLIEVDYGGWTGRSLAQLARTKDWKIVLHTPSMARFPGGEGLLDVQERAVRALQRIAAAHRRQVVAVVSHGDVIRLVLAHFAGVHADLFQRIEIHPASVSAVSVGRSSVRIVRMNDTGTLADLAPPPRPSTRKRGAKVRG